MCRWLGYSGAPLYLEETILKPKHSLIDQSLEAHSGATTTNGDGFGIGWYDEREIPGVYRHVQPAWNDRNLRNLTAHIESPLFLAHVRAATGTAVQETNCHPFSHQKWLFVHNGLIRDFSKVKRELAIAVEPRLYPMILGTTDSELMFFLALTFGLEEDPLAGLERMVGFVEKICREHGIDNAVQLSIGLSDGERLLAVRYSTERNSRTLFHSKSMVALQEIYPHLEQFSPDTRVIVSEPIGDLTDAWEEFPESTAVIISRGEVEEHTFEPRLPD
ncbi:MAG: class II glutamine amidotransferase [Gammaproteobacteria bacterium]|nr:MAG: class II glutamine amidotransferase [Gammaproteobacteria bacterium]